MKKLLIWTGVVAAAWAAAGLGFYYHALSRRTRKPSNRRLPDTGWWDHDIEKVRLSAHDGEPLVALAFVQPEKKGRWAIVAHGHTACKEAMYHAAKELCQRGLNVLIPDLRGHGETGGRGIGMGWTDRPDIVVWSQWICKRDPSCKILLYGESMGAATVLMASGEELPEQVTHIVADCGYTSVSDIFEHNLWKDYRMPPWLIMPTGCFFTRLLAGYDPYKASAVEQVRRNTRPLLLIHGDLDTFVPTRMVYDLRDAAGGRVELVIAEGFGHGQAYLMDGYWDMVLDWFGDTGC